MLSVRRRRDNLSVSLSSRRMTGAAFQAACAERSPLLPISEVHIQGRLCQCPDGLRFRGLQVRLLPGGLTIICSTAFGFNVATRFNWLIDSAT